MNDITYDHYIAIDWSMKNMAIARMTKKSNKITTIDVPSSISDLQVYLKKLSGSVILTIEETTTTQWLYAELRDYVDRIFICNPHRNRLLSEGPKNDKIDAAKLVQLLRADLLKEVYHSCDTFVYLRKLVRGYENLVKSGVRLMNQRHALLRALGRDSYEETQSELNHREEQHVLESLDRQIKVYEDEKKGYVQHFKRLSKQYPEIQHQRSLPGIEYILAVKIVSRVVSPHRFPDNGHYLSYAGLIKLEKMSGGRSYGKKNSQYCRQLKSVYKSATLSAIGGNNPIDNYYRFLIKEKGYQEHIARHKACRRLAILSLGVFKSKQKYTPYRKRKNKKINHNNLVS